MLKQLELKPFVTSYADELFELVHNNRDHLRKWLLWVDQITTVEDTESFLARSITLQQQGKMVNFLLMRSGKIIGLINIREIENGHGTIGYWLSEEQQNNGFMSHACLKMIEFCQQHQLLHKILLYCSPFNTNSQAIARKCGFTYVETLIGERDLPDEIRDLEIFERILE